MKLSRELKTGIVVIGGLLLFILGFSFLKATPIFDNSKEFFAVYKHVGGLQTGTQVSINGFNVGKVNDIRFKDSSGNLLVTFSVDNSFEFSKNSLAELYDTGIIGGKGIQINPVFDGARMAQSGDTLKTNIKPGLTELVQQKLTPLQFKIEGAVSNADSLLMNFNDVFDEPTKKNLRESVAGLNKVIENFEQSTATINALLENKKHALDSSITNINTLTGNFARISDSLSQAGLSSTIRNLQESVQSLNEVLAKLNSEEGSLGKLVNDKELYENLTLASKELELLLQDFRLNPKRYVNVSVFGKKQKEYVPTENDPAKQIDDQ
ncbi:MAG: MlaD family protein [Flavobacteriaceae bacterium]